MTIPLGRHEFDILCLAVLSCVIRDTGYGIVSRVVVFSLKETETRMAIWKSDDSYSCVPAVCRCLYSAYFA